MYTVNRGDLKENLGPRERYAQLHDKFLSALAHSPLEKVPTQHGNWGKHVSLEEVFTQNLIQSWFLYSAPATPNDLVHTTISSLLWCARGPVPLHHKAHAHMQEGRHEVPLCGPAKYLDPYPHPNGVRIRFHPCKICSRHSFAGNMTCLEAMILVMMEMPSNKSQMRDQHWGDKGMWRCMECSYCSRKKPLLFHTSPDSSDLLLYCIFFHRRLLDCKL